MDWGALPYLIPYILSLIITSAVGAYAWRHRDVIGATPFVLVTASQALWTLGYIWELMSPTLEGKIFWDNVQFIGSAGWLISFFAFAVEYGGHKFSRPRLVWGANLSIIAIYLGLVFTDDYHRLIRPDARLIPGEPFSALVYAFTLPTWLVFLYMLGAFAFGFFVLIAKFIRSHPLYRSQIILIIVGTLVPLVGMTLTILGITLTFHRDMSHITFALSNLIIAWGLFRYRLFDLVPIARDVVMDNIGDSVWVLDTKNRVVDLNPSAQRTLGREASEVIGQTVSALFPPHLIEQFSHTTEAQAEIIVEGQAGQRHFKIVISPVRDRRGGLVGRAIIAHDITRLKQAEEALRQHQDHLEAVVEARTRALREANAQLQREIAERKRAEEALRESEALLRGIVDNTSAVIYVKRPDGRYLLINRQYEKLFNVMREQVRDKTDYDLFPKDIADAFRANDVQVLETDAPIQSEEVAPQPDGLHTYLSVKFPLSDASGKPYATCGISTDITDRKRAEDALRESEERFHRLADAAFEGIGISDKGIVIDANNCLAEMLGYEQSELIGRRAMDFAAPESRGVVMANLQAGYEGLYEHLALRKDGSTFPVEAQARTLPFQGHTVRVTAIRDITERKRAEEALQRYAARMEILHEIDRAILAARSPEEIATAALSRIQGLVPCQRAAIALANWATYEIVIMAVNAKGETAWPAGARLPMEDFELQVEVLQRDGVFIYDTASVPRVVYDEGLRAGISVPLLWRGELLGALSLLWADNASTPSAWPMDVAREVADQLAIAIQNARLLAETSEALAREQRLNEVARTISRTLDLQTVIPNVVRLAAEVVGADAGSMAIIAPDGETMTFPYMFNLPAGIDTQPAPRGKGLAWHIVETHAPMLLDDYRAHPGAVPIPAEVHGFIGVPVVAGEARLGALGLFGLNPDKRFSERDVALAESIGRQAGIAVHNARLFEAVQRQLQELTVVHTVATAGAQAIDEDELIEQAIRIIGETLFPDIFAVLLLDEAAGVLRHHPASRGISDEVRHSTLSLGKGIIGTVAARGQPWRVPDVNLEPAYISVNPHIRSELAVPLKAGERVIGVFNIESTRLEAFSEADERLLVTFADQLATAIERVRLLQAERDARRQAETVRDANLALTQTLELESVLQALLDYLGRLVPYDTANIMLLQTDSRLAVHAVRGYERWTDSQAIRSMTFDVAAYRSLHTLLTTQKSVLIPDTDQYPGWVRLAGGEYIRNWLGVPLVAGGKIIGLYSMDKSEPGFFTEEHVRMAEALAAQAAVAIENARLFRSINEQREQLRALSARLAEVEEAERRRLAQELHDQVGQSLTALGINLNIVRSQMSPRSEAKIAARLKDALGLVEETTERIRDVMAELRPAVLDDYGLAAALRWYGERFSQRTGLAIVVSAAEPPPRLPPVAEASVFRIVQEALTNVAKHAQARQVRLTLESMDEGVRLAIIDDGAGFDPAAPHARVGG